ncbi:MAG: GNAT family protein [Crinalium sp.]
MKAKSGQIHTGRTLYLRRTVPNDAQLLFAKAFSQPDFMGLYNLTYRPSNVAEVYRNLVGRQQIAPGSEKYLELMIVHKQRGAIGVCALADYNSLHRRAEFLIGLFEPHSRGISYGLEASLMVLDLAFNRYNLHKLYAITYSYNTNAQSGLKSLGFRLEGISKEHIFNDNTQSFVDLHNYGITVDEFRVNQRLVPLSCRLLGRDITSSFVPPHSSPEATPPYTASGQVIISARAP